MSQVDQAGWDLQDKSRSEVQTPDFLTARSIKQRLLEEQRAGWEAGQPPPLEGLVARWPGNPDDDPDTASLLFEEYCQRRRLGEQVTPDAMIERFPAQKAHLASLSYQQDLLRSLGGDKCGETMLLALPAVGDELFGFHLRQELGRGSFARVFLAEQKSLADRPVVVKASAIDGDEPQTLAQLQHTNIVPIYSVHEDAATGLRAVCMPYFGGASLSRVLQALWAGDNCPNRGQQLVEALTVVGGPALSRERQAKQVGFLPHLAGLNYVRASVWIIARLAEALQHAHERGILHRDIKPSNVLLGADGQPMLLDFNLSQSLGGGQAQAAAALGGTVAYMAPEHLRALASRDPALVRQVDQRADIYGLGMVLYEMLTGRRPFDQSASYSPMPAIVEAMAVERGKAAPSLRERRTDVPWSLESIARKCLAPNPAERYQHAEQAAEDLRRYLEDRALQYAPELSRREQVAKFVRRHPRLTQAGALVSAAVLLLGTGAGILAATRAQLTTVKARAYEAEGAEARERKQAFVTGAERARILVNTSTGMAEQVKEGVSVCEQTLGLYDILRGDDWQQHPAWQRLEADDRQALAEDARELLLLLAWGKVFLADTAASAGIKEALRLLERAEAIPGLPDSSALWHDRGVYLAKLGDLEGAAAARAKAEALTPASARDRYLLATAFARQHRFEDAIAQLKQALQLNPRHYWSLFQLGILYENVGDHMLAYGAHSACIPLWPEFAWGYYNRGVVLQQLKRNREALGDFATSLKLDPKLVPAHLNRALLYLNSELRNPALALADLDAAAALGCDEATLHNQRGIALEMLGRHPEADAAFERALARAPDNVDLLLSQGFVVSERSSQRALSAFQKVLKQEPRNTRALYGCAMLFQRQARDSLSALTYFNFALQVDPMYIPARRNRANVLAYRGESSLARQDIDWCVKADPSGETVYAAACVYALLAGKAADAEEPIFIERAIQLLEEAFKLDYGKDKAAADADLKHLHHHPEFRRLLRQLSEAHAQQRGG